ncbi:maleylpyruvate isomerase N-terminal domain-containing protein [Brevibacterium album]|uniref:maleylpyruvate isomerase N-terminal domain-containing protein n=1 Tax=Brevibacterium album TaxID=417948 RepID=UPI00068602A1|nr:maleylpyruvate isomerase family mycothiol-dependent enzyme [Brevibacterium album]
MTHDAPPPYDAETLRADLDLCTVGERFYLKILDQISPAGMSQPSILPDWSRTHVAMHVVHNAEGFMRLLDWARTGVENPMYPSRAERDAQIEESAAQTSGEDAIAIAHEVVDELADEFAKMAEADWAAEIVSGRGGTITAAQIPWLRTREVFVHALDLGIGATTLDFPAAVVDRLLDDIAPIWEKKGVTTHYALRLTDRDEDRVIRTGAAAAEAVEVTGEAAEVLSFLMGRGWPRSVAARAHSEAAAGASGLPEADGIRRSYELPAPPAWL